MGSEERGVHWAQHSLGRSGMLPYWIGVACAVFILSGLAFWIMPRGELSLAGAAQLAVVPYSGRVFRGRVPCAPGQSGGSCHHLPFRVYGRASAEAGGRGTPIIKHSMDRAQAFGTVEEPHFPRARQPPDRLPRVASPPNMLCCTLRVPRRQDLPEEILYFSFAPR